MFKLAVGVGDNKKVIEASELFLEHYPECSLDLICDELKLIEAITGSDYDAVIRGSLPSNKIMKEIKKTYVSNSIQRATFVNSDGKQFLLSPVGIDEGKSVEEKFEIVTYCADFLEKLNIEPKIAILANGRKGDYGRSEEINLSIDESEQLVKLIEDKTSYNVKNYYILIEQAINDKANIIIAPNGIIGNIIFRTLILINKWPSNGAVTFGIDKIYIDTSRDQDSETYLRSMELAYNLSK